VNDAIKRHMWFYKLVIEMRLPDDLQHNQEHQ
jgi:hypothetical protein